MSDGEKRPVTSRWLFALFVAVVLAACLVYWALHRDEVSTLGTPKDACNPCLPREIPGKDQVANGQEMPPTVREDTVGKGLFFFDGRFIDPPYVVSIVGTAVRINNILIYATENHTVNASHATECKDPIPINEKTAISDWIKSGSLTNRVRTIHAEFGPEDAEREILAYLRSLPFLEKVERDPKNRWRFQLIGKSGDTTIIGTMPREKMEKLSAEDQEKESRVTLERVRAHYLRRFQNGNCILRFSTGFESGFGPGKVAGEFSRIIQLLRDPQTPPRVSEDALYRLGLNRDAAKTFASSFSASPQLEKELGKYGK